jgi:hypothetical protein
MQTLFPGATSDDVAALFLIADVRCRKSRAH